MKYKILHIPSAESYMVKCSTRSFEKFKKEFEIVMDYVEAPIDCNDVNSVPTLVQEMAVKLHKLKVSYPKNDHNFSKIDDSYWAFDFIAFVEDVIFNGQLDDSIDWSDVNRSEFEVLTCQKK